MVYFPGRFHSLIHARVLGLMQTSLTISERAEAFKEAYPNWPAAWPSVSYEQGRQVLYATWLIGNDYRNKSTYYGAYPNGFLDRVMALFPDSNRWVLHAFSGSLPKSKRYTRIDINPALKPDVVTSVYDVGQHFGCTFNLIIADPPYTSADAEKYGTPMINRGKATRALADVTVPGGHLAWLDTVWPMHSKDLWVTVGRITIIRSTNHRVRLLSLFERVR